MPNNLLHLYYSIHQLQGKLALKQILSPDTTGRIIFTISLLRTQVWANTLFKSKARVSVIPQNLLTHEEEQQTAEKSKQKSDGSRGLSPLSLQEWDPSADTWLGIFPRHPPSKKHTLLNHTCTQNTRI